MAKLIGAIETEIALWMENPDLDKVSEAYEMIPFLKASPSSPRTAMTPVN